MARKDRMTSLERELMYVTALEDRMERFLKVYSRPTRRYDKTREALEEVARTRLLLREKVQQERGVAADSMEA